MFTETATTKFIVGQTYSQSFIGDSQLFVHFTIKARTAKSVTVEVDGKTVRRGLKSWYGVEQFKPFGSYSMAMIVSADKRDRRPVAA